MTLLLKCLRNTFTKFFFHDLYGIFLQKKLRLHRVTISIKCLLQLYEQSCSIYFNGHPCKVKLRSGVEELYLRDGESDEEY